MPQFPPALLDKLHDAKERLNGVESDGPPSSFSMQPAEALQLQLLQERRRSLNLELQLMNEQEARYLDALSKKYGVDMTGYTITVNGSNVMAVKK